MGRVVLSEDYLINLKNKLVELVNYADDLKEKKKAYTSSVSDQIKESEKKILSIGKCIKNADLTILQDSFSPDEIELILNKRVI